MAPLKRETRMAELRALQHSDPRTLIEIYCKITGQAQSSQLPHQTSFTRMIATIVELECRTTHGTSDILADRVTQ
jgi:hypothetical protein